MIPTVLRSGPMITKPVSGSVRAAGLALAERAPTRTCPIGGFTITGGVGGRGRGGRETIWPLGTRAVAAGCDAMAGGAGAVQANQGFHNSDEAGTWEGQEAGELRLRPGRSTQGDAH